MATVDAKDILRSLDVAGRMHRQPPSLNVELSGETLGMLSRLAQDSGLTLEETILRAIVVYKEVTDARRDGKAVGIVASRDALETQFVGF